MTTPMYFASGSNNAVEIAGFARIGHPIGVSAAHLNPSGERALHALKGSGVAVFVDSGAFSEVTFPADGPPVVVHPMTAQQWARVMGLYLRLARSLDSRLSVVAPDCIGDQQETLRRLRAHAPTMRKLRKLGANILVPIQRGAQPQGAFDRACAAALGFNDYVRALPCKKKATSLAELKQFIADARPRRVHLLGMGPRNRQFERYVAAATSLGAELTCDSNLLIASVGRSNGRRNHGAERLGGRRIYTKAQDLARDMIAAGLSLVADARELAIPLAFARVPNEAARWAIIERQLATYRAAA